MAEKKQKPARRYVYMAWRKMIDPRTGEEVRALVASSETDRKILRARKFRPDGRVRVEIKNPRNAQFHRLVHAFGMMLIEHVDSFERHGQDAHAAVKQVQAESGAECDVEEMTIDLGSLGKHIVKRNIPRSISFDELDEDRFQTAFKIMFDHVAATHWPDLPPDVVCEFEALMEHE
jgi:hypothetical protein